MSQGGDFRTRRSALTFATGLLGTAATLAIAFVTTPLILKWLGEERFGAARAAADWFSHLSLLELGLGGALAPLLALALGKRDAPQMRRTLAEGIRAYLLVAAAAVAGGLLLTAFITRLVPVSEGLAPDLRTGCLVAAAALLFYPFAPFRALADADQRGWLLNVGSLLQSLLTTAAAVLLAWQGYGITGQFVALALGQLAVYALLARDGLARHGRLLLATLREGRHKEERARIRQLNTPTLLFNLAGRVGLLTDNIVIALILGPALVVPLFLTQRLIQIAQGQLQGVGNASWAALGELHALGRREVFNERLIQLTKLVAALGLAVLVPIAAHNRAFIALWIGPERYGGDLVTVLAAVNALLLAIVSLWGWCFSGTGQVAALVPVMLISAGLNLALSITASLLVGLPGPLIGTGVAIATTTLWYLPARLQRDFGTPVAGLARAVIGPLLWALVPGAAIAWAARRWPPHSWPMLFANYAAAGALMLAVWWVLELKAEERSLYRERVRAALRRA